MQSIRTRLMAGTATAVALILTASGIAIYSSVRTFLIRDFDQALTAKARALATMVEWQHGGKIIIEYDPAQMPEYSRAKNAQYFQCWAGDGQLIARSDSLSAKDMARQEVVAGKAAHQFITLPDGRAGRQTSILFQPMPEEPRDAADASRVPPLLMTASRSTEELNETLERMFWLLVAVCGSAMVASSGVLVWIVSRGLSPVNQLAWRIEGLDASKLSQRLDMPAVPSELAPVVSRLNDLLDRLSAAFSREKSFTSDVAHELRTPLAGLETSLEVCASRPRTSQEYQETVGKCLRVARQMHSMIDNLLSLARAEAGQLKLIREPVEIRPLLDECWALFSDRAAERSLSIEWHIEEDSILRVDREKLRLVLHNLFDNAVTYADPKGAIRISAQRSVDGTFRLEVANTGNHLTSEQVQHVFDRFWRSDAARTNTGVHCGLGLTLSRRMIELMGGTIYAHSAENNWFVATIQLNVESPPAATQQILAKTLVLMLLAFALIGCQAPNIDMAGEAARATGISDAIVFRGDERVTAGLSADQAVRLALSHDPRIQGALARVRVAEADAEQARLLPNPILNIDVRLPEGGGQATVEATLTGDLIAILEKPGRISAADKRLRAAAADAITTVLDIIVEVQEAYASAQSIDAQLATIQQRANIITQLRDVADRRFTAGEGTKLDVLTLDSQRIEMAVELSDKKLDRTAERLKLARLIGDPRGSANWQLDSWQSPPPISAAESSWIDSALTNRPEIHSHEWELSALSDDVKTAAWAPLEGGEVGAHGERSGTWAVGPTVTTPLPIFDFGQAARARVKALRLAGRAELAQQRLEVIEEVRLAYATYTACRDSLDQAQNQLLPSLEQQRQQAEITYRSGDADLTTLLLAETALQETRAKLVDLQEKVTVAAIHLHRAAGGAGIAATVEATTMPSTRPSDDTTGTPR